NLYGLAVDAQKAGWDLSTLTERLIAVSCHFKEKLVPHIERIAENQHREMCGKPSAMRLDQVANLAFLGARYIWEAKELQPAPDILYSNDGLESFKIERLPYVLVVVLEEWFLNVINHIAGQRIAQPVLVVRLGKRVLSVESSGT